MALRLRLLQDRRTLGAVVALAFDGVEAMYYDGCRCALSGLSEEETRRLVLLTTTQRRLSLGRRLGGGCCLMLLYDRSEEAVAWLVRWLEAVTWLVLVLLLPSREGRLISSNDSDRIRAD
jgi:uncharacterized membrane-anchored protein